MYNYPYYWQNMQQCNLITSQFYSLQSQNVNCVQKINEACTNVAFGTQQQRIEDLRKGPVGPPKSCHNCKHRRYGFYNLSEGACEMFSDPAYCIRMCIYSNRMYWEPRLDIDIKHSDMKTSISTELLQCNTHEETLEVARKHGLAIDLTKQEEPDKKSKTTTFIDFSADLDNVPLMDLGIRTVYETEHSRTVVIENKPEKKYTVYDLYDLVFPDDPIKAHFDAERKRINEEYEKQKAVVDKLEVPEVRINRPEPIPTVTYDDHPILVDIACALAAVIILSMVVLVLCEIFFIIL